MAGDVDDLADKVEAGDITALHGAGRKRVGADAAGGNFRFIEALGAGRGAGPRVQTALEFGKAMIREAVRGSDFEQAVGQARGQGTAQSGTGGGEVAACGPRREQRGE